MQTYDTSDFQLAVTLYSLGYKMLDIDKSDRFRAVFRFMYEQGINDDVRAFFSDDLTINPRLILTNTKMVKDRLMSGV